MTSPTIRQETRLGSYSRTKADSKKMEYGPGTVYAVCPSSHAFGVGGQSYSNFLAFTVECPTNPSGISLDPLAKTLYNKLHSLDSLEKRHDLLPSHISQHPTELLTEALSSCRNLWEEKHRPKHSVTMVSLSLGRFTIVRLLIL